MRFSDFDADWLAAKKRLASHRGAQGDAARFMLGWIEEYKKIRIRRFREWLKCASV